MSTGKSKIEEQSPYSQKPWLKQYDFWVPEQINFPRQPIYQMINLAALHFADRPATAFLDSQLTFSEIKTQVDKLATALSRLGISKGDRVGIMLPNCPQYLISFFAIVRLGAIVANVNPIYTPREVEMVARDSGYARYHHARFAGRSRSQHSIAIEHRTGHHHKLSGLLGWFRSDNACSRGHSLFFGIDRER